MSVATNNHSPLRAEIADSWKRVSMTGLLPSSDVRAREAEFDNKSRLLKAATPVMQALELEMSGANVGALLADKSAVIIGRCFGNSQVMQGADRVGAHIGAEFTEETSGTNAIATPFETHLPVDIQGHEHYLDSMKAFRCVGMPIYHPLTHRFEGVLDLMADGEIEQSLLRFISARLLRDIQDQLVNDIDSKTAAAIAAFHALKSRTDDALILFGDDYTLNNKTSLELLDGSDHRDLATISAEVHAGDSVSHVTLSSGRTVAIRVSSLSSNGAKLLRITPTKQTRRVIPRNSNMKKSVIEVVETQISSAKLSEGHVLITGEPGSGLTYVAQRIADTPAPTVVQVTFSHTPESLFAEIHEALQSADAPDFVIVEHIERLSFQSNLTIADMVKDETSPRFIFTETLQTGVTSEGYVQSLCSSHINLKPLRALQSDFAAICETLLTELSPNSNVKVNREVVDTCKSLAWNGNLTELRTVLMSAISQMSGNEIQLSDLPDRYQHARPAQSKKLTELELAEKLLIEAALTRNSGNKVHAAGELGISRSTLYARLKYFNIS